MSIELQFNNAETTLIQHGNIHTLKAAIDRVTYHRGEITTREAFLNRFRFMGAPRDWHNDSGEPLKPEGQIYGEITYDDTEYDCVPIKVVAENVKSIYGGYGGIGKNFDSNDVLYKLGNKCGWYKRYWALGAYFDQRLFGSLWIRNWGDKKTFYIEDGNTRALCYALRLICDEEEFTPVKFIWCRSWRHVLSWADTCNGDNYDARLEIDGIKWL